MWEGEVAATPSKTHLCRCKWRITASAGDHEMEFWGNSSAPKYWILGAFETGGRRESRRIQDLSAKHAWTNDCKKAEVALGAQ
jgi:hypothetical protein